MWSYGRYLKMKFEYKIIKVAIYKEKKFEEELNRWGKEGWELVNTLSKASGFGTTTSLFLIFKREK